MDEDVVQLAGISGFNVQRRVSLRSGWLGLFAGESLGSATEREIDALNLDGYRVAFIVNDKWSFFRHLLNLLVTVGTLGFISQRPGLLIIGEAKE